ncbi:hypothetical protein LY11_04765 [Pedobacter cryoconitis]|uniref:Aa3 type cytochrome c oxidase subunit IV n=1 Tax=Pedobacter cryoconitis TaxID=188932 RepID=A0A327S1N1_9SPHI|nr:hypothetical protein LY11_04765 [Pedobacter cryoconitis]
MVNYSFMSEKKESSEEFSFWSRYKDFATTEILLYVIMIVGIFLGLMIFM